MYFFQYISSFIEEENYSITMSSYVLDTCNLDNKVVSRWRFTLKVIFVEHNKEASPVISTILYSYIRKLKIENGNIHSVM